MLMMLNIYSSPPEELYGRGLSAKLTIFEKVKTKDDPTTGSSHDSLPKDLQNSKLSNTSTPQNEKSPSILKVENIVVAKRMFANALVLRQVLLVGPALIL